MLKPEPFNYVEHIIRDADSYGAVLSEANLEITQIEPGCLSGRHVRFGLPSGQFSYVETSFGPTRKRYLFKPVDALSGIGEHDPVAAAWDRGSSRLIGDPSAQRGTRRGLWP